MLLQRVYSVLYTASVTLKTKQKGEGKLYNNLSKMPAAYCARSRNDASMKVGITVKLEQYGKKHA